ncbi:hypothetical protein KI387_025221 [Taxus chinensis]|uniref:LOB domain-containing protein n=1 Tax=Taxus chinensis TaxID=29808 RepID=A0AA38L984_TAXCH|nr:hypothetical protein KI387_025221 [Taxus chinensis]
MEHKKTEASAIAYPCAACKMQRRKCGNKCLLAPYFPPHDPQKFCIAHRVFGAGNIVKILRDIPVESREDAVSSMVYEARARVEDPVYGCTGAVCRLQKQVLSLQSQLANTQTELFNIKAFLFSRVTGFSSVGECGETLDPFGPILSEDVADPFGLWEPPQTG